MRLKVISAIFMVVFLITNASADHYAGKVKNLYVNATGLVLVNIDNGSSSLNCSDGTWPLNFNVNDLVADHWMSLLLTARAQNKTIKVGYTPNEAGRCAVSYFYFHGFDG